jgi:FeS assembly SUF system protein
MFGFFGRKTTEVADRGRDVAAPEAEDGFDTSALVEPPPPSPSGNGFAPVVPDPMATLELKPRVVEALISVYDPEIPVNIYELGLIYDVLIGADRRVLVRMTLTSPNCPSAQSLPGEVRYKVKAVAGVADAHVEIVWEPPWTMDKMSDTARLQLGLM